MPSYRSITLSLRVPANCKEVAEYEPPPPTSYHPPSTNQANIHDPFVSPPVTLLDVPRSIVSVYTLIHDNSNFWLQYSIAPPYPPNALYYFKLFISGTEVASWGCGEEDGWRGCTMWGIFAGDDGRMERRDFFWGKQTDGGTSLMEVRVFRARGRKRVVPEVGRWEGLERGGKEISANKGGALPRKLPRRYYRYALLDSLDAPFAIFRYYCRSWRQLNALGIEDLLSDSSRPTSRSSHNPSSKNDEQERDNENRKHDDCSSNLSTNTGSSGSSGAGASSGEELLTQFASSGLPSDLTKAKGTAIDLPSYPSKLDSKELAEPTNLSISPGRHIPHPLPPIPQPSFSSVAPPQVPLKDSPVSEHDSLEPPPVPPKHSRPSPNSIPPRSALFEPKTRHDALTPSTFPSRNPLRTPRRCHPETRSSHRNLTPFPFQQTPTAPSNLDPRAKNLQP
ncbi:MAG: hypothetical protein OHK93_006009 [Ramalina farinacea]|uniref:Uncharacterized protein n=1 Tax=Ramalina farinacea TaxID=258253 RepID=A0AA43QHP6_9LECA|nr:hypothetical protein [Ramalina farinacea]